MYGEYPPPAPAQGDIPPVAASTPAAAAAGPPGYPHPPPPQAPAASLPHPQHGYPAYAYPAAYLHPGAAAAAPQFPPQYPSTSTAAPPFPGSNGAAVFSSQMTAVPNSSATIYSIQYPPPVGDAYNVPGYPAGHQPSFPANPAAWPHPTTFQAPGVPPVFTYPTGPTAHYYEESIRRSRSPRRDLSPTHHSSRSPRRSLSPTARRPSRSPGPRRRRDERSSSDCWKRSSSYISRERSTRRSEDGRRSVRSPDRKGDRMRSPDRKCERTRSPERSKMDRNRSPDRKSDRTWSPERKADKPRSPGRKSDRSDATRRSGTSLDSGDVTRKRVKSVSRSKNRARSFDKPRDSGKSLSPKKPSVGSKSGNKNSTNEKKLDSRKGSEIKREAESKQSRSTAERGVPKSDDLSLSEPEKMEDVTEEDARKFEEQLGDPLSIEEILAAEKKIWIRSAPADLYYERDPQNAFIMKSSEKGKQLQDLFRTKLIVPGEKGREETPSRPPPRLKGHRHSHGDSSSDDEADPTFKTESQNWLEYRSQEQNRLHQELWQNLPKELNDGPACRCSKKARESGIRHGVWVGEEEQPKQLDPTHNNFYDLYHYRITISPPTNFLVSIPTMIRHDEHDFLFEGFSMFTRRPIPDFPVCKIIRFNIEYSILFFQERMPENFTINELNLFSEYFFYELLELWDWKLDERFIFMPRFARDLSEDGKELLSMNEVLNYLIKSYKPLIDKDDLDFIHEMKTEKWEVFQAKVRGMMVTIPGKAPSTIRVDNLDREHEDKSELWPEIVHFGLKPSQLCYAGNTEYQKQYRDFVKYRHLLANMPKPTPKDKQEYDNMENKLMELRTNTKMKRDTTVVVSSEGFYRTGLRADIVQHAMLLPVLVSHLRFHFSLEHLEQRIGYKFTNRFLLQQALTHPSYKENFGTNPDHVRNTLSNCGIRQPEYGDKKVHAINSRKRGINTLINIMSKMGKEVVTESKVKHNERLEYLGDAVVEFITSAHLFFLFPDLEEGGLATYRSAIVLNQNLAELALALGLEKYILFSHGPDLCHDSELRHAMANCFEAFLGAIFLDGGINVADQVFNKSMFEADRELYDVWGVLPLHPLQTQEPDGDRHWIEKFPHLRDLVKFEEETGIEFKHIRVLARAFTDRSVGPNNLTLGSNQRMEFLGDSVLQLVTSEFLYKHFPEHHEGHLSLLRASLVNNRTQAVVCDDLGMTRYAVYSNSKPEIKVKDKADLLEAFIGALYVDKDLFYCQVFAQVCFFPRLYQFILNQDWNDPKSKLQQCCLTLRTMDGRSPDIPIYKVIECKGPSNTREYTVAVYFRGNRLAKARGHSIQQAEFNAADKALKECAHLFPHLNYQKRVLMRSFKNQGIDYLKYKWQEETQIKRKALGLTDEGGKKEEETENSEAKKQRRKSEDKSKASKEKSRSATKKSKVRRGQLERRSADDPPGGQDRPQYDYYYNELYWGNSGGGSSKYRDWHTDYWQAVRADRRDSRDHYPHDYRDRYYEDGGAYGREDASPKKTEDKESRRTRHEEKKRKKQEKERRREEREKRRLERGRRTSGKEGKSPEKHSASVVTKEAETELISEDEDMNLENKMEDMVKDAVEISDDEMTIGSEKADKSESGALGDDEIKKEIKQEIKVEINDDFVMKQLLNSTEDISADEDEAENIKKEVQNEDCTAEQQLLEVKIEENVLIKSENSETMDDQGLTGDKVKNETLSESTKLLEENTEVTVKDGEPVSDTIDAADVDQEDSVDDTDENKTEDEQTSAVTVTPPPPDTLPPKLPPLPELSKSKEKKKERKKLDSSERVRKEIEEIESKLARKKAKAAKLAEKERKRKEKELSDEKKHQEKKVKKTKVTGKGKNVESKETNAEYRKDELSTVVSDSQNEAPRNPDNLSEDIFDERDDIPSEQEIVGKRVEEKNPETLKTDYQDEGAINVDEASPETLPDFSKKFKPISGTEELTDKETVCDGEDVENSESSPKNLEQSKDTDDKKEEDGSDLEEGECSDDGEEDAALPVPELPPPQAEPPKEKVTSIKPFKIQDRKELQKQEKTEKPETKELTDKEKEREEKKKRWRKESPKKSTHKDRDYRDDKHRRGSHRSPSPRDRSSKYYDYDRRSGHDRPGPPGYYDYSSRSPPSSHHPASSYYDYYDRGGSGGSSSRSARSPRSSRRSTRSPSRSKYGSYESSRDSRDYRY